MRSASVDFPWSMCATVQTLRIRVGSVIAKSSGQAPMVDSAPIPSGSCCRGHPELEKPHGMPRSRTVLKRQRQTEVRRVRNKSVRSELKTLERKVRAGGDTAATELRSLQRELDQAAAKGVIHP